MKKTLGVFVAALFVLAIFVSCGQKSTTAAAGGQAQQAQQPAQTAATAPGKAIRVGYTMPTADHGYIARAIFWAKKAMADWQAKDPNITFDFVTADTVTKQANDIQDMMTKGIDALVVFPIDASITSQVEKAHEAGIYTVVMDRGTTKPVYDSYLHNNDLAYATLASETLAKQLNYKGNVVIIEGIPTPINTIRVDADKAVFAKYGMKVLDSQPGNWNQQKAHDVMQNYLQKYQQIDGVITNDDDMMIGAQLAVKEAGRTIKAWMGGGADKRILKIILDGSDPSVTADVTYPPDQCADTVTLAILGARNQSFQGFYQKKPPLEIVLAAELITKANAADYINPDEP
ncbi:MAG TPA: substrate-binding domain-containing protein [Spirochaetia bacterium]|nr:substrate-binding domain-containing protein [Spirochaetia bacterium]